MKCEQCGEENLFKKKMCQQDGCPSRRADKAQDVYKPEAKPAPEEDELDIVFADPIQEAEQEPQPDTVRTKVQVGGGKWIELNDQQEEALQTASLWLQDREALFFRLSGYAGTGKTTISKLIIKKFAQSSVMGLGAVVATAPTHKAKKVLADATNLEAQTIQSLLGLAPNVELADFDVNKPEFAPKKRPMIDSYKLVVLDEGSMLNKALWEMIKTNCRRFNVKIIVMLDEAQLPPVKENLSAVITDKDVTYAYELTKVERQAGDNPLMLVYDAIRNNLDSVHDQFHKADITATETRQLLGDNDPRDPQVQVGHIFTTDIRVFGRAVIQAFKDPEFEYDPNHCKVLCWTNDKVRWWNQSIRMTLTAELAKNPNLSQETRLHLDTLMPNELLMGYQTYTEGISNAGEYEVIAMQYDEKTLHYGAKKEWNVKIRGYRVSMRDVDQHTILNTFIVDPEPDNVQIFTKVFNSYLFLAKTAKQWPAYFSFKAENLLIKDVKDNANQLICKKDLDYAYALTVHKSQGSTYNQVFIDQGDIDKNKNIVERNKLKYVAYSRPRYLATVLLGGNG